MSELQNQHPIQIIEDDPALAQSLLVLLGASNYSCVHYKSAEDFLASVQANPQALQLPTCVISDVRLPKLSGMDAIAKLKQDHPGCVWSVIFMTGHADVGMAVEAMQSGAYDFLTKPFDPFLLPQKLNVALQKSSQLLAEHNFVRSYLKRQSTLTEQELKICQLILDDMTSREIAESLGNSTRTIEIHRASVFRKMEVSSILELAQQSERYQLLSERHFLLALDLTDEKLRRK